MLVSENDEENENYAVQYNDILNTLSDNIMY